MKNLLGKKIKIISDNESYDQYRNSIWIITHVARSTNDHQGYDEGINSPGKNKMGLVDCKGLPFSLYEYEFKIV
jgi:hypothetical protein